MKAKKPGKSKIPEQTELKAGEEEKLSQLIDDLQKEKAELFEKLQRVSADYANFQKRVPKQIQDTIAYEKEKIIKTFLPIMDNFEHVLQNARHPESADAVVDGVQIIYDQMHDILKSHDVEQINALGEKFDPVLHQAMMQKAEPQEKENIVLEEFQKGYKLNGRVIRPSRVIVNKPSANQPHDEDSPEQTQDESQTTDTE